MKWRCVSYFLCGWDKIFDWCNLKEQGFSLAHSFRDISVLRGGECVDILERENKVVHEITDHEAGRTGPDYNFQSSTSKNLFPPTRSQPLNVHNLQNSATCWWTNFNTWVCGVHFRFQPKQAFWWHSFYIPVPTPHKIVWNLILENSKLFFLCEFLWKLFSPTDYPSIHLHGIKEPQTLTFYGLWKCGF